MQIISENPESFRPKTENVIIIDIAKVTNERNKIVFVRRKLNEMSNLIDKNLNDEKNEVERELHDEEWPDLFKDSQLKSIVSDGTTAVDISISSNSSSYSFPNNYYRLIINSDPEIDIGQIYKTFKQPQNIDDVLKLKKVEAKIKYSATCYKLNAKKHYKKYKR